MTWLQDVRAALRDQAESVVPCDGCTACCRSAQFVHVGRDETETLAHVPAELLFPAPGRPGDFVIGYDDRGHCPLLGEGGCSIYAHRPKACRTYDCRVFAAAGVRSGKPGVDARVREWRFVEDVSAVRAAARFVEQGGAGGPGIRDNPARVAVLAIALSELFESGEPTPDQLAEALARLGPPQPGSGVAPVGRCGRS